MNSTSTPGNGSATDTTNPTVRQVHDDIEQTLGSRRARGARGEALEDACKRGGQRVWDAMKRHPFISMAAVGACGVAAASAVGVAELALGGVLALAAYKVLREGEPPIQALAEVERELRG
jgi:hypothetical protein